MNDLIRYVAAEGLTETVYYSFHLLGFIATILFNLWYCKFYDIKKDKAMVLTVCTYAIAYLWIYVLAWAENQFSHWGANNIVRGYIWFPLIAMIPNAFLKLDKGKVTDFIAPCCALIQAVSHLGCIFPGCCYGYPCSWGIYNIEAMTTLFPNQILESVVAAVIVVLCVCLAKKEKFAGSGRIFPVLLVSFGSTRFFLEFLRDNTKVIGSVSILAFHAALMFVVGIVWLIVLKERQKSGGEAVPSN